MLRYQVKMFTLKMFKIIKIIVAFKWCSFSFNNGSGLKIILNYDRSKHYILSKKQSKDCNAIWNRIM